MPLTKEDWGLIDYAAAVEKQLVAVDEVAESAQTKERLIFCTHPPLVSTGRGTKRGDVFGWNGPVLESSRGGRATYHGPSQIVVYPILNLNIARFGFRARDIHGYMHALERAIVDTLAEIEISARAGSTLEKESALNTDKKDDQTFTGVWVGDRKIASVGIGVRKGVSYHGLALNLEDDPKAFKGINPCGFTSDKMTSIEKELSERAGQMQCPERSKISALLEKHLIRQFSVA